MSDGNGGENQAIVVDAPPWARDVEREAKSFHSDEDRMRFVIALSRENVRRETGGPFGAAVFERSSGRLVALGVNSVIRLQNSALHAEMVAMMRAQSRVKRYSLGLPELPAHELFSSCAPCAMCLGAVLWSGVERVVFAATRDDAVSLAFDEGPVFPESYEYLRQRGIEVTAGSGRDEAKSVLDEYRARGGIIYNG
jgi:tRNA(Arg) A34 adenosine deaminase TadA